MISADVCEGGRVVSDDHVAQVGDSAREQSDDDQAHRDAAGEECASTTCEPDDASSLLMAAGRDAAADPRCAARPQGRHEHASSPQRAHNASW